MSDFKEAYKQKLLESYDFIVSFFKEYDLKWWGAYGTILGTVRHNGLIPWDDDIDLYMPRKDYEKLYSLREQLQKRGYEIKTSLNKEYCNSFIKICNQSTSVIATLDYLYDEGVFIDIFPLDIGDEQDFEKHYYRMWKLFRLYKFSCMSVSLSTIIRDMTHGRINHLGRSVVSMLIPKFVQDRVRKKIEEFGESQMNTTSGDYFISYFGRYKKKEMFPKNWFDETIEMEYEGRTMCIPACYDEYLTHMYGDYMKPPATIPESTHNQYYVNLIKKISIEEIKTRVKRGIIKEY